MTKEIAGHEMTYTIHVPAWVPGHEERGHDMPDFAHNRAQLITDGWGFCWGCRLAAIEQKDDLQCHHLSEWAEWDDADPDHVLALAKWWDPYGYAAKMGDAPIENPNDVRLLLMLCQPCHTGSPSKPSTIVADPKKYISGGIHYAPYTIWVADRMRVRKHVLGAAS